MRLITASFVRAFARLVGHLCLHFLPLFQHVVAIYKTCNQSLLKNKGFKEEKMTQVGLYAIGTSTPLESNKSLGSLRQSRFFLLALWRARSKIAVSRTASPAGSRHGP
jgi:hypothetical protein